MNYPRPIPIVVVLLSLLPSVAAQRQAKPAPDVADARYGPYERNVLDFWRAKSDTPTPLVVYIHGGGFRGGNKRSISATLLRGCLDSGISVAAIHYRLSQQAPFPAPMLDSARAIQFLRSKAKEWNIDPERVGATGGSAGAGISLWLGFHDDLRDPESDDPIKRRSTRLTCMAVFGAQSSYDPRFIKRVVGGRAHEHPALLPFFGLKPDELDTPKAHRIYEEASPINYVSRDDPPVFMFYNGPKGPLPEDARPGQGIHHINFGIALQKKLEPLGIECIVRHRDDYRGRRGADPQKDAVEFFKQHFARNREPSVRKLTYKRVGDVELAMFVHLPPGWKAEDRRPGIVFFFGGGWISGSVKQFEAQAQYLAARGMVAARADYRVKRRQGVTPVACVEDAKSAMRFFRAQAAKLGIDPNRIVAAGGSAGGHIAACTALTLGLDAKGEDLAVSSRPNAMVLFNPVLRIAGVPRLEARLGGDTKLAELLSPVLHVDSKTPPALLLFGTKDKYLPPARDYVAAAKKAGVRAELFLAEGVGHGFFNRQPWRDRTIVACDRFLTSLGYLTGEPALPRRRDGR